MIRNQMQKNNDKRIQIAPENKTQNMEASTGKCSAASSFLKILTKC